MTWTVTSGEVNTFEYQVVGKQMTVWFDITASTIAGTPSTQLLIAIPGGHTAVASQQTTPIQVINNGTPGAGLAIVGAASTSKISLFADMTAGTNWTASAGNAGARGSITFAIQ